MNPKRVNRLSASLDNQMATFLVKFCNEEDGLSSVATDLYDAYARNAGECMNHNDYYRKHMSRESFVGRLKTAGFRFEIIDASASYRKYVVFHGIALRDPEDARRTRLRTATATKPMAMTATAHAQTEAGVALHVSINGTLYDRSLIGTMRRIRVFTKHDGTVCDHIITFNNPELRQQFITAEEAMLVRKQLTRMED